MKFGNKNVCYVIFIQTILIGITYSKEWEPLELANYTRKNELVIDTNMFLDKSSQAYTNVMNYALEIQDLKKFQVYIYFIESISSKYTINFFLSSRKNIENFVNDLAWHLLKGNLDADKNSLIILFSINDRQNRIRTGENVRKFLSDSKASSYLERLKSKLRSGNYIDALEDLMYNINWRLTKDTGFYDFLESFIGFIFLILLCVILFSGSCCQSRNEDVRDYIAESKLDKIKKISEKNKNNANFIEDICIICLENYTEQEKNSLKQSKCNKEINEIETKNNNVEKKENAIIIEENKIHDLNNNHIEANLNLINTIEHSVKHDKHNNDKHDDIIRINDTNFENKDNYANHEPLINPENNNLNTNIPNKEIDNIKNDKIEENFLAVLNCGHIFHSQCIVSWNSNHNTCPVCRKKIEDENDQQGERENNNNNQNNNDNCQNQNTNLQVNNTNNDLIDRIWFVQTVMHPSLNSYNYNYDNGFTWLPPVSSTYSAAAPSGTNYLDGIQAVGGLFGALAGGASSDW